MNAKKYWQLTIGLVLLLVVGCGPTTGEIEGTITSEGNIAKPLADVEVILHTADPFEEIARTKTDSQGKYSFADVKPGEYVFSAFIPGQCGIVGLGTEPVTVEAGNSVIKDISLPC